MYLSSQSPQATIVLIFFLKPQCCWFFLACFRTDKDFSDLCPISDLYSQFPKTGASLSAETIHLYLLVGANGWIC